MICDLWQNRTDSVHDIRVVNNGAKYHLTEALEKCIQEAEKKKKNIYLEACLH